MRPKQRLRIPGSYGLPGQYADVKSAYQHGFHAMRLFVTRHREGGEETLLAHLAAIRKVSRIDAPEYTLETVCHQFMMNGTVPEMLPELTASHWNNEHFISPCALYGATVALITQCHSLLPCRFINTNTNCGCAVTTKFYCSLHDFKYS